MSLFTCEILELNFIRCRPGEFLMGSDHPDEIRWVKEHSRPTRIVQVDRAFFLAHYPVTQEMWYIVLGDNPSQYGNHPHRPVENVSWNDCQVFLTKLNEMEETDLYRLPTEAEWEYACRAGFTSRWSFGNDPSVLTKYAWFDKNASLLGPDREADPTHDDFGTHPVGQKEPNSWGFHDMHGNVMEWVQDEGHGDLENAPNDASSPWEVGEGEMRSIRGGSWKHDADRVVSAVRFRGAPTYKHEGLGFRIARGRVWHY